MFKHRALDQTTNSIRLIKIEPLLSPQGLIQCSMYPAQTNAAEYRCLSYQWGPEGKGGIIQINKDPYFVRQNLLHFLQRARQKHHSEALWIDAICIDQNNDSERNHQVRLMGRIYSKALEVYIWLGDTNTANINATIRANVEEPPHMTVGRRAGHSPFENRRPLGVDHHAAEPVQWPNLDKEEVFWEYDAEHPSPLYGIEWNSLWDRAWVTQEVALARRIRLIRRDFEMEHETIAAQDPYGTFGRIPVFSKAQRLVPRTESLLLLLCRFQQHKCSVQRDLIFSLHALCIEGPNINIDYGMPEEDLLRHVLEACSDRLCFCSAAIVATALDVQQVPYSLVTIRGLTISFFEKIDVGQGSRSVCAECRWGIQDQVKPKWYLICLSTICPKLDIHFLVEYPEDGETTSVFHVLGSTHWQANYIAHNSGLLEPSHRAPGRNITLQIPLQVMVDFDYSRGILYYDEEHLNQKKDVITFDDAPDGEASGVDVWVEEV